MWVCSWLKKGLSRLEDQVKIFWLKNVWNKKEKKNTGMNNSQWDQ